MKTITWADFEKVAMHVGTIIKVEDFPEAKKPAYKVWVDFGEEIGTKKTSAQVTFHYTKHDLLGKQIQQAADQTRQSFLNFWWQVLIGAYLVK